MSQNKAKEENQAHEAIEAQTASTDARVDGRRERRTDLREEALLRSRQSSSREKAVLVAVEFTAGRRRLSPVVMQAKAAAKISKVARVADGDETDEVEADGVEEWHAAAESDFDASLAEFQELARSAGAVISAVLVQRRPKPDSATLVGGGKLDEIVATVASTGASLVLFDHDLTPTQARNVEARLPCTVIDRTQLILDIFARHARTREGMLQVELAQLEYQLPPADGQGQRDVADRRRHRHPRTGRDAA